MKRPVRNILVLLVIAALIFAGVRYATREKPVQVTVAVVESGTVEKTVTNTRAGTIKACRRARLSPNSGGQVAKLTVTEGSHVEAGDVLVELWNDDLMAQAKLAEAELSASRAAVTEACVTADVAQREADRIARLRQKKVASIDQLDKASGTAKAQRAGCQAARARARVSQAQVDVARATLARTVLTAPFAGIVAEVNGEVGEYVTPSPLGIQTPPAIDLIDNSCLYVSAPIDEVDAPLARTGMPARVTMDAFGDRHCAAHVRRIAPYVLEFEKQARTVEVEANFDTDSDCPDLLAGYSADLEIILETRDSVLRIPTEAILEGNRVLVLPEDDGILSEREIETGISNWQWTEVTRGLYAQERVVTSVGGEGVVAGARATSNAAADGE